MRGIYYRLRVLCVVDVAVGAEVVPASLRVAAFWRQWKDLWRESCAGQQTEDTSKGLEL